MHQALFQYYYQKPDGTVLTSDRVLDLLARGVPRKLSRTGFWSYMLSGAVQEPFTLIDGVYSRPPDPPSDSPPDGTVWTRETAQAAVTAAVEAAVREALARHGGTPCAFLSGGIDSGALVAVMRNVLGPEAEIRTCCVIHEDPRTDERQWARLTAERNRTRHEEFLLTGEMFTQLVTEALDAYDLPSMDGINSYIAARFARAAGFQHVVSGEGGDELFAGYGQFSNPRRAYAVARRLAALGLRGTALGTALGRLLTRFAPQEKFKKLGQLMASACDPYFLTRRQFDPDWIHALVRSEFGVQRSKFGVQVDSIFAEMQRAMGTDLDFGDDLINRCSRMETRHNLRSMYMRDAEQMSAPFGLDVVAPLLAPDVVRLLFAIPGALKCDPKMSKPLLVGAAKGGLPEACVFKKKQGFALPFDRYFKTTMRDMLETFFEQGGTGFFDRRALRDVWHRYLAGRTSWMRVWQPFVLDHWMRQNGVTA